MFVGTVVGWLMVMALRLRSIPRRGGGSAPSDRLSNIDELRCALGELNRNNVDDFSALLHPRVDWYPVPEMGMEPCRGRGEILANVRRHLDKGFRLEDVELVELGEDVLVGFRPPAHLPGPAAGRLFNVFRFQDGQVVRIEDRLET